MAERFKVDNISYTNKDFNAIYAELLDMGDALSAKWKPSATNESDPGIVLIKENAVIGDKLSYNADKNILEAFPSSVTQEGIARQLFEEQLACPPNWYRAASGVINFRYVGDSAREDDLEDSNATIPQWTTVQDEDSTVTYTIIDHDKVLAFDGTFNSEGYRVLQGTPNSYVFGISTTLTIGNLDDKRRLYFQEYNVAQNGVFVANIDDKYNYWKQVTLLSTQDYGSKVYKFGVDKNNRCYVEFPSWAGDIFESGICIDYITTNGVDGNIANNVLEKFANDVTVTPMLDGEALESITLTSLNISMQNPYGKNPDTIQEMYANFEKTMGTFNTLVTIRDYNNALKDSEVVGNGFVCDRTNDLQRCYSIIHTDDEYTRRLHKIEEENGASPISAYDLKLYLIQPTNIAQTAQSYKDSFKFVDNFDDETFDDEEVFEEAKSSLVGQTIEEFEENKCISQDFVGVERYKPLFFKNKYPINCSIIPIARLSDKEIVEVKRNVVLALYEKFNGSQVKFGEEIDYDDVYNTILNADSRISAIHLQDINYTTYAVYRGSQIEHGVVVEDKYIEVPVGRFFQPSGNAFTVEEAVEQGGKLYAGVYNSVTKQFTTTDGEEKSSIVGWDELVNLANANARDKYIGCVRLPQAQLLPIDHYDGRVSHDSLEDIMHRYPWGTEFATDIYAKSVLNGNTPLIKKDTTFARSISQKYEDFSGASDVYYLTTDAEMTLNQNGAYRVRQNENIQIFSPSYTTKRTFTFGYKLQYLLSHTIPADTDYRLQSGEEILVIGRPSDSEKYRWYYYKEGDIIKTNKTLLVEHGAVPNWASADHTTEYNISAGEKCGPWLGGLLGASSSNRSGIISDTLNLLYPNNDPLKIKYQSTTYNPDGAGSSPSLTTVVQFVQLLQFSQDSLMVNDTLEEREQIKVKLDNQFNYFWILNNFVPDATSSTGYSCTLFAQGESEYTLNNDEYFIYSNQDGSAFYQLGAGTKITRDTTVWSDEWSCEKVDIIDYFNQTDKERASYWKSIAKNCVMTAYEQTIYSFGENVIVQIVNSQGGSVISSITNVPQELPDNVVVNYQETPNGATQTLILPSGGQEISNTVRSALQLVCTDNVAQELKYGAEDGWAGTCNQKIIISNNPNSPSAETSTISSASGVVKVLASRDCNYEGSGVNVQAIDAFNNRTPLQLYPYSEATESGAEDYTLNSKGGVDFVLDSNNSATIATCLQSGEYLMPFKFVTSNDAQTMTVSDDNGDLADLYGVKTFEPNKQYHIKLSIEDADDITFTFTKSQSGEVHCHIGELIKYTMPDGLKGSGDQTSAEWYVVLHRMHELDPNDEFDFDYAIPNSDLIENPLDPIEFNNPKHIMNQFTICEIDLDAMGDNLDTIRILNNVR